MSSAGFTNAQKNPSGNFDENIAFAFSKGENGNEPAYYTSGSAVRMYNASSDGSAYVKGGILTISTRTEGYAITSVTINTAGTGYVSDMFVQAGIDKVAEDGKQLSFTSTALTWTADSGDEFNVVSFTHYSNAEKYKQIRVASISVTYELTDPSISVDPSTATIDQGRELTITSHLINGGDNVTYSWSSDNAAVTVPAESNGASVTVTAASIGNANVTVSATWDGNDTPVTASCAVTVVEPRPAPTGITISQGTSYDLVQNGTVALEATVAPEGSNQEVVWSIDSENVVTLDETTGVVSSTHLIGSATVTVTSKEDSEISTSIKINVNAMSIKELIAATDEKEYTFQGYVFGEDYSTSSKRYNFDVVDADIDGASVNNTNSIMLFGYYDTQNLGISNGDFVTITGTLKTYNGTREVTSPSLVSTENTSARLEAFVNGADTNWQCEYKFSVAKALYLSLSESEQNTFKASAAATRYEAWALALGESAYTAGNSSNNVLADNAGIIVLGSMLGMAAVAVAVSLAIVHNTRKSKAN